MKKWALCRSGLKGLSNDLLRTAYMEKLSRHNVMKRSVFGSNLHRAIRTALEGAKCIQNDALSLSGYCFDFEILLGKDGVPIQIPWEWKYRSIKLLGASLGVKREERKGKLKIAIPESLVESMKRAEESCNDIRSNGDSVPLHTLEYKSSVNIASDWGCRFASLPRPSARKILIEGDGIHHYAQNCDHSLGHTVLKRRHIQCLGWELVTVS